jgi:hypothetical protein
MGRRVTTNMHTRHGEVLLLLKVRDVARDLTKQKYYLYMYKAVKLVVKVCWQRKGRPGHL